MFPDVIPGRRRRIELLGALIGITLALTTGPGAAATATEKEVAVRAAFLFRLAFFVTWPESAFEGAAAPLTFCLSANTTPGLREILATQTAQRSVNGRGFRVLQLESGALSAGCHLIYSEAGSQQMSDVPAANALTVVDTLDGLAKSGALALVREEQDGSAKLQFYVYRKRLQEQRVTLSAQLLQLVRFYEPPS